MASQQCLYIIDGHSLLYRAFFAVPPFTTSKGIPTNAVYGVTKMILKLIKDKNPDYLVVVFDAKGPTFRTQAYEQYKAHRPKMPDQLIEQRPYVQRMVDALHIKTFEIPGIEADDVIGTLSKKFGNKNLQLIIVTGDKDLMQLVLGDDIQIYDSMKDVLYGPNSVYKKMGVSPEHIVDLLALMGDSSDNIPGVRGIGPKTALKLLEKYETLDGIYQHLSEITGSVHDKLQNDKELAYLSFRLATIQKDVPIEIMLDDLKMRPPDIEALNLLCDELEFSSLRKELSIFTSFDSSLYEQPKKLYEKKYNTVDSREMFDSIIRAIKQKKTFAFDTETTSLDPLHAELVGISLSYEENVGYYIPVGHKGYKKNLDKQYVLEAISSLLHDDTIRKYGHNLKYDISVLETENEKGNGKKHIFKTKKDTQMDLFTT